MRTHGKVDEGRQGRPIMDNYLEAWIRDGEDWLVRRIVAYAKRQGYTAFTSTLEEAWRISIRELSATLILAAGEGPRLLEFEPLEAFSDPISEFAVSEAARHRERGIDLKMFLGLFKYYRQAYLDRVSESSQAPRAIADARFFVHRVFDRLEIAFCTAWVELSGDERVAELQRSNRRLTNEKNLFLTVVESLASPVVLVDDRARIRFANVAGSALLGIPVGPGVVYYSEERDGVRELPGWLAAAVEFAEDGSAGSAPGPSVTTIGERIYEIHTRPMLDISEKFLGTVVILHEITALRRAEHALEVKAGEFERLSYTDGLTGLLNRRGLEVFAAKHLALARRAGTPVALLYADVDNLKVLNDRHGHQVGDAALIAVAEGLRSGLREADLVARIGGDEFVALLAAGEHGAREELVERLHERIRRGVSKLGREIDISLSTGWADFDPERVDTLERLLHEADGNMYEAKRLRAARDS